MLGTHEVMSTDITLYWGSGSIPCWRAMICLEEKGLSGYDSKLISLEKKEQKSDEILKINPRGQVPAFKHGDVVVNESMAICLYLENIFKKQGTQLLPDDPSHQALVLQRFMETQNIMDKSKALFYYRLQTKQEDWDQECIVEKIKALAEELSLWEKYLSQSGDGFLITEDFTLADAALIPALAFLKRMKLPMKEGFPHLASYYERVKDRPSVQSGWPPHWKETPGYDYLKDV
ncbi:glutathione S-transferase A-like isoform X2 [Branchiostoma floridae x Branchiostoma japonicum]